MPDETFTVKMDKCTGGKLIKDWMLVRRNADDTEKIIFFMIDKSQKPSLLQKNEEFVMWWCKTKADLDDWEIFSSYRCATSTYKCRKNVERYCFLWGTSQPTQRTFWILKKSTSSLSADSRTSECDCIFLLWFYVMFTFCYANNIFWKINKDNFSYYTNIEDWL